MTHLFISYARKDIFFVDRLRNDLKQRGVAFWIDREGLSPGMPSWEKAIRQAIKDCAAVIWVVSPASYDSSYVKDEIAIARMEHRTIYPLWADGDNWLECVPLGMGETQYVDARGDKYEQSLNRLLGALGDASTLLALPDRPAPKLTPGAEPRNPYKGLSAFTEKDAPDFFGREALIKLLCDGLALRLNEKRDRFLAVLGPSGAGKSSVIMAGLIPALKKGRIPGSAAWTYLPPMVPGIHPVEALADMLYSALPDKSLSALETDLHSPGARMLHRLARQIPGAQVLLYIDQFEELFTLTVDSAERQQFIDLITYAATESDGKLIVVLTMRADFYGHPMHYPQLGALVSANTQPVLPMTISELWEAIEAPARLPDVGLTFDEELAAEIIFALRERKQALAGALPLLEFTLTRLYAERDGTRLSLAVYRNMGGVEGTIGAHCEAVFKALSPAAQDSLGRVFLPLVNIDEESGEPTRRRAPLDVLPAEDRAQKLIEALVKNRLLQTGRDGSLAYLEIAHEALFGSWERLVNWIETTRQDLRLLRQVEHEARDWDRTYLLSSERLKAIHEAVARLGMQDRLEPGLREFIYPQALLLEELNNPTTSNQRRLRIGDDLALLGDPRPGVGVRDDGVPDMVWLPVAPGGEITIGRQKFTVQPFYIAQYQVTYVQYQAFVDAPDGFDIPEWWRDFPADYRRQELAAQRTKAPNNPRDSVSWYQSVAFARWLSYRLHGLKLAHPGSGTALIVGKNAQVRLPAEWEWQWAAQGGNEARRYPWGDWQPGYANTSAAGLGRAIAVGMYLDGCSICGALDMAGNLYEWCQNDKENPQIVDGYNNGESKVLRGGAFHHDQYRAACAPRDYQNPQFWSSNFGLRVVVGPLLR